jgi:hypothetical protein
MKQLNTLLMNEYRTVKAENNTTNREDNSTIDFGAFLLAQVSAKRLSSKPDGLYLNKIKTTVSNLYQNWHDSI